jgi:hypothetical protein
VFIVEMEADPELCHRRNLHDRTLNEITEIIQKWEPTPPSFTVGKVDRLLAEPIQEVRTNVEAS